MDNSQWVSIHIRDRLENGQLNIRDSFIYEGGFHDPENQTKAMTEDEVDKVIIPSQGIGEVCARGRRGSEGLMDLYDGETKICELHWDNQTERPFNDFEVLDGNKQYKIEYGGWSPQAGPMGHVFIDISAAEQKKKKEQEKK